MKKSYEDEMLEVLEGDRKQYTMRPPMWYTILGLVSLLLPAGLMICDYKSNGYFSFGFSLCCLLFAIIPIILIVSPIPGVWEVVVDDDDIKVIRFGFQVKHFKMSDMERIEFRGGDYKCYVKGRKRTAFTVDFFAKSSILFLIRLSEMGIDLTNKEEEISVDNPIKTKSAFDVKRNKAELIVYGIMGLIPAFFLFMGLISLPDLIFHPERINVFSLILLGYVAPICLLILILRPMAFRISVKNNTLTYHTLFKEKIYDINEIKYYEKTGITETHTVKGVAYKYTYFDRDRNKLFSFDSHYREWNQLVKRLSHCRDVHQLW